MTLLESVTTTTTNIRTHVSLLLGIDAHTNAKTPLPRALRHWAYLSHFRIDMYIHYNTSHGVILRTIDTRFARTGRNPTTMNAASRSPSQPRFRGGSEGRITIANLRINRTLTISYRFRGVPLQSSTMIPISICHNGYFISKSQQLPTRFLSFVL